MSSGLFVPEELHRAPRTIFRSSAQRETDKFYDQIGWFIGEGGSPAVSVKYNRAGFFDFTRVALKSQRLSRQQLSWYVSDHYPLWVEFKVQDQ